MAFEKLEENSEEIPSVALLSPACYSHFIPNMLLHIPNMCLHIPSKIFTQYMGPVDHNKILTLIAKLPKSNFDFKPYTQFFHDGNYCSAYKKEHLAAQLGM